MLVLARKKNETIVINDQIVVEVLQIKGNTIRLGIVAPDDVRIARGELKPFQKQPATANQSTTSSKDVTVASRAKSSLANYMKRSTGVTAHSPTDANEVAESPNLFQTTMTNAAARLALLSEEDQEVDLGDQPACQSSTQPKTIKYQAVCEIELPNHRFHMTNN